MSFLVLAEEGDAQKFPRVSESLLSHSTTDTHTLKETENKRCKFWCLSASAGYHWAWGRSREPHEGGRGSGSTHVGQVVAHSLFSEDLPGEAMKDWVVSAGAGQKGR